ncbi:MAG: DNA mismatch repair protein MutS [Xanthobacteraceae bacterium]
MKAHLMFGERDFDPQQLLIRREREQRHNRGAEQEPSLHGMLPWNEAALRQDLGLDVLFRAMAAGDRFLVDVARVAVLSSLIDLPAIRYRQDVLADSLKNAPIVRRIYQITVAAIEGERKNYWGSFSRYPSATLHRGVDVLQIFVAALRQLRSLADRYGKQFASRGYSTLFAMLKTELSDEYFDMVEEHLYRLKFNRGALVSAQLGKGNKGTGYVLRKPFDDRRNWLTRFLSERPASHTYKLHPRDEGGARALSELNDQGVNLVANALAQSTDHILSFFCMLRTELAFYIGCLNLHERLSQLNEPVCLPTPAPAGERQLSFSGLYDAALALAKNEHVVGNDLKADQRDVIIVTGANTGGKSTFLRSVGIAHVMMQAGMFVPAEQFSSEVCNGVVTHYRREEDKTMDSGKWDEELARMSNIVDRLNSDSLMLFNESFASTNEREGSEIATQIVSALLERRVKVLYVTHLYHFARAAFQRKSDRAIFLRAERRPDGSRPFKLIEAEPLQRSYGEDLYKAIFRNED